MYTTFYIDKISETSADTLLAIGFATLLDRMLEALERERKGILIQDRGPYYEISLPTSLSESDLPQLQAFSLIKPLVTAKQTEKQGKTLDGFLYEDQQQRSKDYRERRKQLPSRLQRPEAYWSKDPELEEIAYLKPAPELGHYQTIYQMKIASSFNELALRWSNLTAEQQQLHILLLLNLFSSTNNDIATAVAESQRLAKDYGLKKDMLVSALQIINPTTGKGANKAKASELSIGNQDSLWLLELLKFVGFMHAAAPFIIQGSKDRKTYVLQPAKIELSTLQTMMRDFREVCWSSSAIKLDIMASLRFAQAFVEHRKTVLGANLLLDDWEEPQVVSTAGGFEVTFYKDMGSAYATMNVSSINLPEWLPDINTLEDAQANLEILEEHIDLIQHLRRNSKGEEGSEEFELLRLYRDFLSGRTLKPFWKFTTAYSSYLIGAGEQKRYVHQLTTQILEKLIMSHNNKLIEITSNAGFKRIASAIRQSTVTAQYQRFQQKDRPYPYEIRYGLGQELMREAQYRDRFMTTLCDFLQKYSAETAREEEKVANRLGHALTAEERRTHRLRANVSATDIDEIADLIDRFQSAELICSMLVAYGYARDAAKKPDDTSKQADDAPKHTETEVPTSATEENEASTDDKGN